MLHSTSLGCSECNPLSIHKMTQNIRKFPYARHVAYCVMVSVVLRHSGPDGNLRYSVWKTRFPGHAHREWVLAEQKLVFGSIDFYCSFFFARNTSLMTS